MKKVILKSIGILAILLLSNCANKETQEEAINRKKIEYYFYNPKVNPFNNKERKIVFNVDLLKTEEMAFLKNVIVKNLIGKDFHKLAGVSVYYNNAVLNQNVKFTNENILGIIVYELDKNDLMRHRFYIKNAENKYEEKLSLLENMMSTTNQEFIVYKFFPDIYKTSMIGISTLRDVNLNSEKLLGQRNEFDLFRVVETYKRVNFNNITLYRSDEEGVLFRGTACVNCVEGGNGVCDSGLYCNPEEGGCEDKDVSIDAAERGILTPAASSTLFNLDLHRNLRDNLMKQYIIGEKHIAYYYAISGYLQTNDYQLATLYKIISTLPNFNNSIEKLLDQSYNGNEIIITESLKSDLFIIIGDLKNVTDNPDYQFILNDLENDINSIKNKNKEELLNELN